MQKLTRFEDARLVSARSLQLALGAPSFAKTEKSASVMEIAEKELRQNVMPLEVRKKSSGQVQETETAED